LSRSKNYNEQSPFIKNCEYLHALVKGKSVPLQAPRCPEGSRKLRFPDYLTMAQNGGKVVSLTHRPLFTSRKCSWFKFLLATESTRGP